MRSDQEAELEGLLFGRDEEALEQLGQEVGGGGGEPSGGSLADFLRSYAAGAAGSGDGDDEDDEDGERQRRGGGLVLLEDRQGGEAQPAQRQRRRPVWEDPQDAQLRVNVAARSQLRKLRQTEEESELTGGCWGGDSDGCEQGMHGRRRAGGQMQGQGVGSAAGVLEPSLLAGSTRPLSSVQHTQACSCCM